MSKCEIKTVRNREYRCFFELTLKIIGGKWKPVIVYELAKAGILRFGELRKRMPDVTERMLTKQLREMEEDKIIKRKVYREVPPKVEYSLEPLGAKLIPVLLSMRNWGVEYEKVYAEEGKFSGEFFEKLEAPPIADMYRDIL